MGMGNFLLLAFQTRTVFEAQPLTIPRNSHLGICSKKLMVGIFFSRLPVRAYACWFRKNKVGWKVTPPLLKEQIFVRFCEKPLFGFWPFWEPGISKKSIFVAPPLLGIDISRFGHFLVL